MPPLVSSFDTMFSGPVAWKLNRGKAADEPKSSDEAKRQPGVYNVQFTDAVTVSMSTDMETHKEIAEEHVATAEGLVGIYWKTSKYASISVWSPH